MSVLGQDILKKDLIEKLIVEGLSDRELSNPEGAGFDVRVGELHIIEKITMESEENFGRLGIETRVTPSTVLVSSVKESKDFVLHPNDFVLVKTMESFNVPLDCTMYTFARSTLFRSGVLLLATQSAPGYKGPLVFGLKNLGPVDVAIEFGARIAHVQFLRLEGKGSAYRGQWKGGRVSVSKPEVQV